jgi:hypothetical protein
MNATHPRLALGSLIVAVLSFASGCRPSDETVAGKPLSAGDPKDDESYILGHRWWKIPPTKARLAEIARVMVEADKGDKVEVDQKAQLRSLKVKDKDFGEPKAGRIGFEFQLRILTVPCDREKRPDRATTMRELRDELDRAEYRDGPGR